MYDVRRIFLPLFRRIGEMLLLGISCSVRPVLLQVTSRLITCRVATNSKQSRNLSLENKV